MIIAVLQQVKQVSGIVPEKCPGNTGEFPIINNIKHLARFGECRGVLKFGPRQ